ncbi:nitric oxide reductase transcriptional regulator NorR [Shewanella algae]
MPFLPDCYDLTHEQAPQLRLRHLVLQIQQLFACSAVGLLQLDGDMLKPVALVGLVTTTHGRRFAIRHHPRLEKILATRELVHFAPDSPLPDPYDGLLETQQNVPLPVHDCMGISLWPDGKCWGVLTLDSIEKQHFSSEQIALIPQLARYCETVVRLNRLEREVTSLRRRDEQLHLKSPGMSVTQELIGQHMLMQDLLREIDTVAASDLPVLLRGETGVGKELFAWRLHQKSLRNTSPMIHVNCAALPETLVESELFGHVKGAFSGATTERAGRIEAADGGTLFLDEIGELPLTIQAKLLRTLQNGEIQRLGADKQIKVNVRIIAATNRDLAEMVKRGDFRADLYHRLTVYPVVIPPLRERGDDILLLAGYFVECNRSRFSFRSLILAPTTEQLLLQYRWPGNVRELEHVISRAALRTVSQGADKKEIVTIEPCHLDQELRHTVAHQTSLVPAAVAVPSHREGSLKQQVNDFQRQLLQHTLIETQYNWANAARLLKVDASNLHKLAQRLGLK